VGDADGGYAENRDAHRRNDKADGGRSYMAARHLPQVYGEDQVASAEEHAEQGPGHKQPLLDRQSLISHGKLNSFVPPYYAKCLQK